MMTSFYFKMAVAMNVMSFGSNKNKISNGGFSTHVSHLKIGVYSMGANCLIYPITVGSYSNVKIKLAAFDPAKNSPVIHTFNIR